MNIDAKLRQVLKQSAKRLKIDVNLLTSWAHSMSYEDSVQRGMVENLRDGYFDIVEWKASEPLFRLTTAGQHRLDGLLKSNPAALALQNKLRGH